jgi:hypothetical protein
LMSTWILSWIWAIKNLAAIIISFHVTYALISLG